MCGRFVSTNSPDAVAAYFGAVPDVQDLGQNYNVAPTQDVYGVLERAGERIVQAFHWGLIPSWAKDRRIGSKMINARSETLGEKPAFKNLFAKKRLLVPMDGFYEWRPGAPGGPLTAKGARMKQPMFIERIDGEPLAVAGLWTAWKDPANPEQRWLQSATVITTSANDLMSGVHDRMPVVVPRSRWAEWLDPSNHDSSTLVDIFGERNDGILTMREASTDVNNVRNNRPDLLPTVER